MDELFCTTQSSLQAKTPFLSIFCWRLTVSLVGRQNVTQLKFWAGEWIQTIRNISLRNCLNIKPCGTLGGCTSQVDFLFLEVDWIAEPSTGPSTEKNRNWTKHSLVNINLLLLVSEGTAIPEESLVSILKSPAKQLFKLTWHWTGKMSYCQNTHGLLLEYDESPIPEQSANS